MTVRLIATTLTGLALVWPSAAHSADDGFAFGVIALPVAAASAEPTLQQSIAASDRDRLAFVVAQGLKTTVEACSDALYKERRDMLDHAENGLIVSLAASDWVDCHSRTDKDIAIERLTRLRDIFFTGDFSLGSTRIPLVRQSITPKFRSYGENARWKVGDVLFATLNLPSSNNHYITDAGRNSEFEDRLIADRDWLHKVFVLATRKKFQGIVLFTDGNPLARPTARTLARLPGKRDGFQEIRRSITTLARRFPGRVLLIHNQRSVPKNAVSDIVWQGNLGQLYSAPGWTKVRVDPSNRGLFARAEPTPARSTFAQ